MQLWVTVHRFRCRHAPCRRKIFCERLPQVARVYGRQTERASEIIRLIGYVAGGLPGQRLLARLSIATSDDTVTRPATSAFSGIMRKWAECTVARKVGPRSEMIAAASISISAPPPNPTCTSVAAGG